FLPRLDDEGKRALVQCKTIGVVESEDSMSRVLSFDVCGSAIDYFESLISTLDVIREEHEYDACRETAASCIDSLIALGLNDTRLSRLRAAMRRNGEQPNVPASCGPQRLAE